MAGPGLGAIWARIVSDIEWLVERGCYERVNAFMSLLVVDRLRLRAASKLAGAGVVVDAGAGPGYSSLAVARSARGLSRLVLVDPSEGMLRVASRALEAEGVPFAAVVGAFESLPLADGAADGVAMMFSFRDAVDYRRALKEACRILAPGGSLVILDLYRPDSPLEEFIVRAYLAIVPPLAAVLTGCARGAARYFGLDRTLDRMLRHSELVEELKRYFEGVEEEKVLPGTVIIRASGPRRERCGGAGGGEAGGDSGPGR